MGVEESWKVCVWGGEGGCMYIYMGEGGGVCEERVGENVCVYTLCVCFTLGRAVQ